jgi:Major Facilitator Superfamily
MLGLVYTVVEAPNIGWGGPRTLLSFVGVVLLLSAFVLIEQHKEQPLVRLRILRSTALRHANLGAMALVGSWFGFQFIGTLYMPNLRGWSSVEMALAFLPTGLIVAYGATRMGSIVNRVGTALPIATGLTSLAISYLLFLNIGADSDYLSAMLPTFLLAGFGFTLAFGPLNVAATAGVADEEQGLASGLVQTSFQVGGAIGLAVSTAVIEAGTSGSSAQPGSATALLDGFHPGLVASLAIAVIGIAVTLSPLLGRFAPPGSRVGDVPALDYSCVARRDISGAAIGEPAGNQGVRACSGHGPSRFVVARSVGEHGVGGRVDLRRPGPPQQPADDGAGAEDRRRLLESGRIAVHGSRPRRGSDLGSQPNVQSTVTLSRAFLRTASS